MFYTVLVIFISCSEKAYSNAVHIPATISCYSADRQLVAVMSKEAYQCAHRGFEEDD